MDSDNQITPIQQMYSYMSDKQEEEAIEYLKNNPSIVGYSSSFTGSWLHAASRYGLMKLIDYLIGIGFDINLVSGIEQATAINNAVCATDILDRATFVRELLNRGANPNISRTILSALNPRHGEEDEGLELVRILVEEGGADVNRVYDVYGDPNNTFTAVEWAEAFGRPKIAAYLRSQGAIDRPPQPAPPPPTKKKRKS
ncbi:MAG: hypothetical protein LC104_04420 [Bacteroidales bacterium]|nr:hypothetical protein [Bacteroidales bacterium]